MKKIIIVLALLVLNVVHGQVSPLEDHTWKLERVVTADSTLIVPTNIYFSGNFYSSYYVFGGCSTLGAETLYDDTNMNFNALFPSTNLQVCPNQQELMDIEDFFIEEFFYIDTNQMTTHEPFSYSFSTTADKIYLDITNNVGSIATFYDNFLSQEEFLKNTILIYPNPVNDKLFIQSPTLEVDGIKIYDMNGRLVKRLSLTNDNNYFKVRWLPKGVYILRVKTAAGVLHHKLIKR